VSIVGELGKEKAVVRPKGAVAPTPKKPSITEIAERLAAVPEKKPAPPPAPAPAPAQAPAPAPQPVGTDGFMELDEFEAGLAELETDHGLMKPPEATSSDLPGESAQLIGFEELEEVDLPAVPAAPPKGPRPAAGADLEAALQELDAELPPVPSEPKPKSKPAPPPGGPAIYSVILPQIRSEKKRGEAALVISRVMKVPEERALQITNRVIITVAKDVTAAQAEQVKTAFEKYGFKVRVSKKK
jgi:hypothetical protein